MINPAVVARIHTDAFAQRLGVTVETVEIGYSRVSLVVDESMLNFHGMTHGAIVFALGDIAFAAASNSRGQTAVALNVNISFLRATHAGDHLVAEAREVNRGGATALYEISVFEKKTNQCVAKSQALVYLKRESFV